VAECPVVKYPKRMSVATGTVVGGKIVIEGLSLPEGTLVTVLTQDEESIVRLSPEDEAELLQALDEADREEGIPAEALFERLRHFG
jgi:excinuclease UvrABC helicase subunit UvrB